MTCAWRARGEGGCWRRTIAARRFCTDATSFRALEKEVRLPLAVPSVAAAAVRLHLRHHEGKWLGTAAARAAGLRGADRMNAQDVAVAAAAAAQLRASSAACVAARTLPTLSVGWVGRVWMALEAKAESVEKWKSQQVWVVSLLSWLMSADSSALRILQRPQRKSQCSGRFRQEADQFNPDEVSRGVGIIRVIRVIFQCSQSNIRRC